jgi:hypothetical protein
LRARSGRWKYSRSVHLYTWPTPLDKKSTLAGRWAHANRYTDPQTGEVIARSTHDPLLFDVVADRDESYNVVSRHPDEAARLHAAIEAWEREFFANPRGWRWRASRARRSSARRPSYCNGVSYCDTNWRGSPAVIDVDSEAVPCITPDTVDEIDEPRRAR